LVSTICYRKFYPLVDKNQEQIVLFKKIVLESHLKDKQKAAIPSVLSGDPLIAYDGACISIAANI
jgi:hypothetical protein